MARPARTALFSNTVPGGVRVITDLLETGTGNIYWVDSVNGSTANSGNHPSDALATIDAAVGKCTANQGDTIVVMENHSETISTAGALDLDVAGISVKGLGRGGQQPLVTLDSATGADIDIDAADVTIENIHFSANYADITAAIDVNATGFTIRKCKFTETATNMNALIWIQDAAAAASDYMTIEDCRAVGCLDAANTHFINLAGTGTGHVIRKNVLMGDWGTMAIGGAGIVTYCTCTDNVVMNEASDSDSCINFGSTATGVCVRNICGGAAAQANGIATGDLTAGENYYGVHTEDLQAILDPIAT